jgi:hypothetical protein
MALSANSLQQRGGGWAQLVAGKFHDCRSAKRPKLSAVMRSWLWHTFDIAGKSGPPPGFVSFRVFRWHRRRT